MTNAQMLQTIDNLIREIDELQSRPFRRVAKLRPRAAARTAARHHVNAWLDQFVMLVVRT